MRDISHPRRRHHPQIVMLIISEAPMYLFTLLDILKLKALYKYRLHYTKEVSSHLGLRVYPPISTILSALKTTEKNFWFAYVLPGSLAIQIANKLGIFVYDTDKELDWKRIVKEVVVRG